MSDKPKNNSDILKFRVLSDLVSRSRISRNLGMTFDGNRDLYNVVGYKKELEFQDFLNTFKRGRLGKRIISAPVDATWFGDVSVFENQENEETEFEKKWKELNTKYRIISKLSRFDKLVGLGEYAVMVVGLNDGSELSEPLGSGQHELIYLQPYHQGSIQIVGWETDPTNERYGQPSYYTIKLIRPGLVGEYRETRVHWSRVIHVAEGCLENDVLGTPRLESVFNGMQDLDKLASASAEMFWQGALGGKAFSAKDGASFDSQTMTEMGEEIDEYIHGLRRYLRLQNMDVQSLAPDLISSPKDYLDIQLDLISGDTGIPKRILIGSERGELASSQDESNWLTRIEQRRVQFAEPFMLRPLVDMLIKVGALPTPKDGYQVDWPDLWSMGDQDQATVSKTRTEAVAAYVNAPGIESIMPEDFFLEEIIGLSTEQLERIQKLLKEKPSEESVQDQLAKQELLERQRALENPQTNEELVDNYNKNHDKSTGQFTSGLGGSALSDTDARAIAKERGFNVPPGWKNVKVASDPNADLQVKGKDSKNRDVYIYSAASIKRNEAAKFARVEAFGKKMPEIRKKLDADFDKNDEAKVLYLISKTGFRVGSDKETGAKVKAYGASTLTSDHVSINGNKVTFNFVGKKGVSQNHTIEDAKLAGYLKDKQGRLFNTDDTKIRGYLAKTAPGYKVKDFRTHTATGEALKKMKGMPVPKNKTEHTKAVNSVCDHVASILGNTRTMAKNSYINPAVWGQWESVK